jgi:hypothetical protein
MVTKIHSANVVAPKSAYDQRGRGYNYQTVLCQSHLY